MSCFVQFDDYMVMFVFIVERFVSVLLGFEERFDVCGKG
jgi:hypothetical protein